jgi:ribosomal protein S27AE
MATSTIDKFMDQERERPANKYAKCPKCGRFILAEHRAQRRRVLPDAHLLAPSYRSALPSACVRASEPFRA